MCFILNSRKLILTKFRATIRIKRLLEVSEKCLCNKINCQMEKIMEYLLNLLLLKLNLAKTATRTVNAAIRRCLKITNRLTTEYAKATTIVRPYNMMDLINYSAETSSYHANESSPKIATPDDVKVPTLKKQFHTTSAKEPALIRAEVKLVNRINSKNTHYNDVLVDNLHGILQSQEMLFKNISKLINILEREHLDPNNLSLNSVKRKIVDCSKILSTQPRLHDFLENMIEQEMVRCQQRGGAKLTGPEISLKLQKPPGLAVITPLKVEHVKEAKPVISWDKKYESMDKSRVETEIQNPIPKKQVAVVESEQRVVLVEPRTKQFDLDELNNYRKFINVIVKQFFDFEEALWQKNTRNRLLSVQDEFRNITRVNFINKRQFLMVEMQILKKRADAELQMMKEREAEMQIVKKREAEMQIMKQRANEINNAAKILSINDRIFEIFERKLLFKRRDNNKVSFMQPIENKAKLAIKAPKTEFKMAAKMVPKVTLKNVEDLKVQKNVRKVLSFEFKLPKTHLADRRIYRKKPVFIEQKTNKIDFEDVKNTAAVLAINRRVFQETENVLNTIRIFNDRKPKKVAPNRFSEIKRSVSTKLIQANESLNPKLKRFTKSDDKISSMPERDIAKTFIKSSSSAEKSIEIHPNVPIPKDRTFSVGLPESAKPSAYQQILEKLKQKEQFNRTAIKTKRNLSLFKRTTKSQMNKEAYNAPGGKIASKEGNKSEFGNYNSYQAERKSSNKCFSWEEVDEVKFVRNLMLRDDQN